MIATLRGTIQSIQESIVVVEVSGIGYAVYLPARVLGALSSGTEIFLYTYQHVREDALELFGFLDRADQLLFEKLIQVSGIGPRLGLTILSQYTAHEIHEAIVNQDVALLQSISGVGKKTAQRVVVELQERMVDVALGTSASGQSVGVVEALMALGYSQTEATQAARSVDQSAPLEEQVKEALKSIM